jgi:RyR domain
VTAPDYKPVPIDTSCIDLSEDIRELTELLARNTHDVWAQERMRDGWHFGPERNDRRKEHPLLVPYDQLPESEKDYDRNTAMETLKVILSLGYHIEKEL